jgi:hypothetical protein
MALNQVQPQQQGQPGQQQAPQGNPQVSNIMQQLGMGAKMNTNARQ